MVSFQCDDCQDVVKKPKLDNHYAKCHASFTCVDCSTTFHSPREYKDHTSCISEAEKYQKGLYKGDKSKMKGKKPINGTVPSNSSDEPPKAAETKKSHKELATTVVEGADTTKSANGTVSTARKSEFNDSSFIPSSPSQLAGALIDPGRARGIELARQNGHGTSQSSWNNGYSERGGRGGGRGMSAAPPSFSHFRSRNMATGANETPLGTPPRSFPSLTSSPVSTPRLTPTRNITNDVSASASTESAPIATQNVNVSKTVTVDSGDRKAKDAAKSKKDKEKKKRKSEVRAEVNKTSEVVAEKTTEFEKKEKKEKRSKKQKSEAGTNAVSTNSDTAAVDPVSVPLPESAPSSPLKNGVLNGGDKKEDEGGSKKAKKNKKRKHAEEGEKLQGGDEVPVVETNGTSKPKEGDGEEEKNSKRRKRDAQEVNVTVEQLASEPKGITAMEVDAPAAIDSAEVEKKKTKRKDKSKKQKLVDAAS